jgi:signal transduction histidine kinase/ligand-binding sensor domain-containing protein
VDTGTNDPPNRFGRVGVMLLAVTLMWPAAARAQRPQITRLTVGDGLPSAAVTALAQDRSGRLILVNRGRVVVYDGRSFEPAGQGPDTPTFPVAALATDRRGQVWAAMRNWPALFRWNEGQWQALPAPEAPGGPPWIATALTLTASGDAVVGTRSHGLFVGQGTHWSQLGAAAGAAVGEVTALARFGDEVAVGTSAGLCRLAASRIDCEWREKDERLAEPILALADVGGKDGSGVAVLTPSRVGILGSGGFTVRADRLDLSLAPAPVMAAVGMDRGERLYYGTPRSLFVLGPDDARPQRLGQEQGLVGEGAMAFLSDREGGLWIASYRGLSRIGSWRFLSFDTREGLAEDEVSALAEPAPGELVVGHNGALSFLGRARPETVRFASGRDPVPDRILGFAVDRDGTTWGAAQERGLLEIRRDRRVLFHPMLAAVRAVAVDGRGRLWVAGWRELLVRIGSRFEPAGPVHDGASPLNLRTLAPGPNGRLYLGSLAGLLFRDGLGGERIDPLSRWRLAKAESDEGSDVFAVLDDGAGRVWVGTAGGLHLLEGGTLVPARGIHELGRPVYFLSRDHTGRLWAGTDDGVFVSGARGFRQLTTRHGLAGRETNRGAGLVDHRGDLWIGTDQGLSVYRERHDLDPAALPPVEIRYLETAGERLSPALAVDLPPHQRSLTVHAAPIALSSEETILCRYRLEGFDEDWQGPAPLTAAGLRYTNLPPGRYRFRIAAGWHADGPWGKEAVTAEIRLARPLLQRPWFQLSLLLAVGLLATGGHRLRVAATLRRNAELARLNARLEDALATRERLVEELGGRNTELERFAYTVSHDLKAPLITIRSFAGFLEKDVVAGELERFRRDVARILAATGRMLRLLEDLLDLARAGRTLGPRVAVSMSEIAHEAADNLPALARAELVIPPDLPRVSVDRARLVEVLQNLLGNAAKFMGEQARPRVEVGARESADGVVFFVADNGLGIEPRFHETVFGLFERLDPQSDGSGVGLAVARRVVELHGGRIWVESEGHARGSRFCFTIPDPGPRS